MKIDRSQLTEIKKGETGTGLLIENEGFVSINDKNNKALKESIEKEGDEFHVPYPFKVKAVFQKYGIVNANGRIYPEEVLRREVDKYQLKIKERRSIGECYAPDTLILTETGWKTLADIKDDENILTLNPDTNEIEIHSITNKIMYHYKGKMIRIKGRNINDLVTPNHKFPLYSRNHKFIKFITAEEILKDEKLSHSYIPRYGKWKNGTDDKMFLIKGLDKSKANKMTLTKYPKYFEDLYLNTSSFMKFMGIYLAEGHFSKNDNQVIITQKKNNVCNDIDEMLIELGLPYVVRERKDKTKTFSIVDARLHDYVKQFGNCYQKFIPLEIKNKDKDNLRIFYDWFVLGDGRKCGRGKNTDDAFSASKRMVMDLNEIQLKIGYCGNYHYEDRKFDRYIEDNGKKRLIKGENSNDMYFTMRSLTEGIYLDKRFIEVTEEDYDGDVACVEVPNHIWYCMCNGKCHWTGNCNHPEQATIDLGRIAFIITELHWEEHTLVGEIEIPTTKGFRELGIVSTLADLVAQWILSGIKIGVSSRGVGTVSNSMGRQIVDDNYEIECWDIVSDPSTPGAWIVPDGNTQMYVEGDKTNQNKPIISEKIEKAAKLFNII